MAEQKHCRLRYPLPKRETSAKSMAASGPGFRDSTDLLKTALDSCPVSLRHGFLGWAVFSMADLQF
jgi:hypothetical protein